MHTTTAGRQSGWYLLHLDRLPAGAFGSWKTGESQTWCAKSGDEQTPAERADFRAVMAEARRQHQAERDQQQRAAAIRALGIWNRCGPAPPDHAYLVKNCADIMRMDTLHFKTDHSQLPSFTGAKDGNAVTDGSHCPASH
mgnify:CR=1 FL=1